MRDKDTGKSRSAISGQPNDKEYADTKSNAKQKTQSRVPKKLGQAKLSSQGSDDDKITIAPREVSGPRGCGLTFVAEQGRYPTRDLG